MATSSVTQRLIDHVERHHPKFGSAVMKLRWGGLRSLEPAPMLVAVVLAIGSAGGIALRRAIGKRSDGRARIPLVGAIPVGASLAWLSLWRWDDARWRRSHITLVLDRPSKDIDSMVSALLEQGLVVQRWYGRSQLGATSGGLTCRLRDLRRVNAMVGGMEGI